MKTIKEIFKGILLTVWLVIALSTTVLLIFYNKYGVSVVGDYSIINIDSDRLEPTLEKNDVVIITKVSENKYKVGDYAFFYLDNPQDSVFVNYAEITKIEANDYAEDTYYFNDTPVSYSSMIGPVNNAIVYHNLGIILRIFESKLGFMFFIILPTLFALIYEIYSIVEEAKQEAKEEARAERLQELAQKGEK